MFFDEAGAESYGGDGDFVAKGVVGEADRAVEALGDALHGAEVEAGGLAWVGGDAFEENYGTGSVGAEGGNGFGDFWLTGHAGAEDDGFAGLGDFFEQREVGELEGGDLM